MDVPLSSVSEADRQQSGLGGGTSGVPGWLVSWPVIIVGFLLCLLPGVLLLWLRPNTSMKVKAVVTAAVVGMLAFGAVTSPEVPADETSTVAADASSPAAPALPLPSVPAAVTPSESPTPSASPTASTSSTSSSPSASASAPGRGTALAAVSSLTVKGRASKTGYARDQFGSGWVDVDRNGCDTRNDMLRRDLYERRMSGGCKVLAGSLDDPYTGSSVRFEYGGASEVDIDHLVPLSDAWQKGGAKWPFAKRVAFGNDPLNLQATDAGANRQKGDGDTATWLPRDKGYRCTYVARQVAVKAKYQVWITAAERDAMIRVLSECPDAALPKPGSQPTIAANTGGRPPAASTPKPSPKPSTTNPTRTDPRFGTCAAAKAAGYGPYVEGRDPEYGWYQDRDHDGVVCER